METKPTGPGNQKDRLDSWKSIAEYLHRDVRTVQRWEKTANLPVRRLRSDARSTVFAWTGELDDWLRTRGEDDPSATRARWPRWTIFGAVAALGLVAWALSLNQSRDARAPTLPRALTVEPGVNCELRLSPDGRRVAYTRQLQYYEPANVVIREIAGGSEVIVNATPLHEHSPAWAPNGTELAFLRSHKDGFADVVIASLPDLEERKIARLRAPAFVRGATADASQLDWSPDGRYLLLPEQESEGAPHRITLLETATGRRQFLTEPSPTQLRIAGDFRPRWSPDGRRFSVTRRTSDKQQLLIFAYDPNGQANAQHTVRFEKGAPAVERLGGTSWTPDGAGIIFSATPVGKTESRTWRVTNDFSPAEPLAVGGNAAQSLDVRETPDGRWTLAYVDSHTDVDIVQIPLVHGPGGPRPGPQEAWRTIADSLTNDNRPAVSPDGSRIAFTSLRSGSSQIWVADLKTGDASKITDLPPTRIRHKVWSPDGERITFVVFGPKGRDLMSVRISDGHTRLLVADDENEWPTGYSADGRTFYYAKGSGGAKTLWAIDVEGGTPAMALDIPAWAWGLTPGGRYIYRAKQSFYSLRDTHAEPQFLFEQRLLRDGAFAAANSGIYYLSDERRLAYYCFEDGVSSTLTRFAERPREGIAVSPNEDFVYVNIERRRMRIMVIDDIRGSL